MGLVLPEDWGQNLVSATEGERSIENKWVSKTQQNLQNVLES